LDNFSTYHMKDNRKPRFTLRHLNKLKKMRAAQDLENHIRSDTLEIMYSSPPEQEQGPSF